ncbi:unnamed protein product [Cuscuta campestris]|uniref:Uncharacterized protein n=1 Tax=Cuscuta campestris TaxID=132261 RepID=A0A484KIK2_9ASTE|nr:unnamed protein product [Cuscuta campestris]
MQFHFTAAASPRDTSKTPKLDRYDNCLWKVNNTIAASSKIFFRITLLIALLLHRQLLAGLRWLWLLRDRPLHHS